jgi:high frequency lysogenization protein
VLEIFSMNEERVLSLAGLFQACALAQQLANEGRCDEGAMEASVASVFRIDAPSVVGVYGSISNVRLGLRNLIAQLDETDRDMSVTRMVVTVMRLERSMSARPELLEKVQQGIVAAQRQVEHFGQGSSQVNSRLAEIYASTLSTLKPRVMVSGDPQQPAGRRAFSRALAASGRPSMAIAALSQTVQHVGAWPAHWHHARQPLTATRSVVLKKQTAGKARRFPSLGNTPFG